MRRKRKKNVIPFKRYKKPKYMIVISEGDESKYKREEIFEVIMAKNFTKSITDSKTEIQES